MLAVIGILCMVGFTVGPSTLDWLDGSRSAGDPIVATANGQNIRESDMGQMRRARSLANQFMAGCLRLTYNLPDNFRMPEAHFGSAADEEVLRTRLLAQRAQQAGLVVSDDAINEYLRTATQDKVPAEGFKSLVRELGTTQAQLFNALRTELAAQHGVEMSLPGGEATPAQRWDYYRRLKQRAVVEVAPLFVAEFADEVADPSPDELAKFFDDHKQQEPQPLSPTPGFKVPQQAAFQYFVADYAKFYDEEAATQEEIEKHYEQYKDQRYLFSSFDFPEAKGGDERGAADEKQPDDEKARDDEKQPADAKRPADEKAPANDKDPTDGEKAPADNSDDKAPAEDKSPKDDKPPADDKPPKADKPDQQSSILRGFSQLAAASGGASRAFNGMIESSLFADEKSESAAPQDASEKAAEGQPAEKKSAAPDDTAGEAEEKASEARQSADGAASELGPKLGTEGSRARANPPAGLSPPISDDLLLPGDIGQGAKPKYAPLWKVEDSIRKELAGQKAVERMTAAFAPLQAKINRFTRNLDPDEKQPKPPDLSKLAKEQDLAAQTTELLTGLEFKEQHPGLADATPDQSSPYERPRHFIDIGYGNMAVFQSAVVKDLEGNRYLVWKTDQKEAYVPELSEVRDEVLQSWKQIQARELARNRAKSLVEKAREADKPLSEAFGAGDGVRVTTTPAFTWLTRGMDFGMLGQQAPPKLSEVEGVQDAGPDFMREAFSLSVGDVGLAMNQPQTICYVIRLVSLAPSREVLRNLFMVDPYAQYQAASQEDRFETTRAWIKNIETEAHLEWKEPPDERAGSSSTDD